MKGRFKNSDTCQQKQLIQIAVILWDFELWCFSGIKFLSSFPAAIFNLIK